MDNFKESITSDGIYHIAKEHNGLIYSLSIDNSEADDQMKQYMQDIINGQIEIADSQDSARLN